MFPHTNMLIVATYEAEPRSNGVHFDHGLPSTIGGGQRGHYTQETGLAARECNEQLRVQWHYDGLMTSSSCGG